VLDLGHRRIGAISLPIGGRPRGDAAIADDDIPAHRVTRGRLQGYRETVAASGERTGGETAAGGERAGGEPAAGGERSGAEATPEGGSAAAGGRPERASLRAREAAFNDRARGEVAAGALLDAPDRPTALLCMSDELAIGALRAAAARGLAVPADLSVVGWDDTPEAARADPPLTTIRQSLRNHGRLCAELAASAGPLDAAPREHLEPWELIVRASTGAL
jgi:DNA-binding LacI/PurR family transcriptional regulator